MSALNRLPRQTAIASFYLLISPMAARLLFAGHPGSRLTAILLPDHSYAWLFCPVIP